MHQQYNKNIENVVNIYSKIFIIKTDAELSFLTQKVLESCCNKQFYQVLETIEYLLKFNKYEQNLLVQILYSIAIALQNNTKTNFFDIKIYDIRLIKTSTINKINGQLNNINYIRIHCFCVIKPPKKKKKPYW